MWDGNEVWLLVAGGATFAAFPLWYARLFSGFYLALFLVLLALIVRGVSFEFRGSDDRPGWRRTWDVANFVGSLVPAVVWGVAFTDLVHGVPLSPGGHYYGGLLGLLHPIALVGGLASLAVFVLHGSLFLSLKTSGDVAVRARRAAGVRRRRRRCGPRRGGRLGRGSRPAGGRRIGARRSCRSSSGSAPWPPWQPPRPSSLAHRDGWAFAATGAAILAAMGAVFSRMFPAVLPASNRAANALTIAASAPRSTTRSS